MSVNDKKPEGRSRGFKKFASLSSSGKKNKKTLCYGDYVAGGGGFDHYCGGMRLVSGGGPVLGKERNKGRFKAGSEKKTCRSRFQAREGHICLL